MMQINTGFTLKHELTWPKATRLKTISSNKDDTLWTHHLFQKTYYFSNSYANLCLRNSSWKSWPEADSVRSCSKNDWWSSHQTSWYGWAGASYYFRRNISTGIIQRGRLLRQWLLLRLGATCTKTIPIQQKHLPARVWAHRSDFLAWTVLSGFTNPYKNVLAENYRLHKDMHDHWVPEYENGFQMWHSYPNDD